MEEVAIAIVIIIALLFLYRAYSENVVSLNTTAGGPDNIIRTGVLASGHDRELELPKSGLPNLLVGSSRAHPMFA